MKIVTHSLLFLFVVVGMFRDVPAAHTQLNGYSFSQPGSPSSPEVTTPIYMTGDCPAIQQHFLLNPIPIGAIDLDTGREIIGYEIICDGLIVTEGGQKTPDPADQRDIPRAFGTIRVFYAPQGGGGSTR